MLRRLVLPTFGILLVAVVLNVLFHFDSGPLELLELDALDGLCRFQTLAMMAFVPKQSTSCLRLNHRSER